jgi:hypothetical protein
MTLLMRARATDLLTITARMDLQMAMVRMDLKVQMVRIQDLKVPMVLQMAIVRIQDLQVAMVRMGLRTHLEIQARNRSEGRSLRTVSRQSKPNPIPALQHQHP